MRSKFILPFVIGCTCVATSFVCAGSPSVETVSPGIGQRGTECQLKLVGAGLTDATEVMLYSSAVTCVGLKATSDNELLVRLKLAADCPLGTHAFRVRSKRGISELRAFRVTPFPVVLVEEPNNDLADAKLISPNVTVAGVLESGDVDCYRISLRRGERLAAEVEAIRLGASMLDTVLTVYGPDSKAIVTVDDTALCRQDPFATIVAPADGDYVVQVRETNFEGDENSRYALHVGNFPRPAFVFPAGGPAGRKIKLSFGGDASGSWDEDIVLANTPGQTFSLFTSLPGVSSPTPNLFRISSFDNTLETEPNDSPDGKGASTALPIAFNGVLERAGDVDCFPFKLTAGIATHFEVFAGRIGSPVDTVLSILDDRGNVLAANDDDETHDSRLVFESTKDAEFILRVTDKRGTGGAGCVYRVEATQPGPKMSVFLPRPNRLSQEGQAISIPRGNRVAAMVAVQRMGVEDAVDLQFQNLPDGVSATKSRIPADRYWMPVVLESHPETPLSGAIVDVRATVAGDKAVSGHFVQVVDLVAGSADALFHSLQVDRLAVAVTEDVPLKITLDEPQTALAQDGTIGLIVRVQRSDEFDGPVEISLPFLPAWVDGPAKITVPADQTSAIYPLRAYQQTEPRIWPICAEGRPGNSSARSTAEPMAGAPMYRRGRRSRGSAAVDVSVSSQLQSLRVSAAPVTGTFAPAATEPGKMVTLVCELTHKGEIPEQLSATLEGLPNRVHASSVTISREVHRVTFTATAEPTAPLGTFADLVCRLSGKVAGQEVSYCVGRGGILRIEPAGTLVTDETGRVLTPLEALRRSQPSRGTQK